jgi:hypothetical protein
MSSAYVQFSPKEGLSEFSTETGTCSWTHCRSHGTDFRNASILSASLVSNHWLINAPLQGTTYIYQHFLRPQLSKHEPEVDRHLHELKTRAGDVALQYWRLGYNYAYEKVLMLLTQGTLQPPAQKEYRPPPPPPRVSGLLIQLGPVESFRSSSHLGYCGRVRLHSGIFSAQPLRRCSFLPFAKGEAPTFGKGCV